MHRAPAQCLQTRIAFPAKPASRGPYRSSPQACIRSHAPDTLLPTGRLLLTPLWFHEASKTQTILLSLKLRSTAVPRLRFLRIRDTHHGRTLEVATSVRETDLYLPVGATGLPGS